MHNNLKLLKLILLSSVLIKIIAVIIFYENGLSDEWLVLFNNFNELKMYSYYTLNGQNIPICSNTMELAPICPPKICPLRSPSIKPTENLIIPPIGTQNCSKEQVFNSFTARYEWKNLCR